MKDGKWFFDLRRSAWSRYIDFYMKNRTDDGIVSVARNITFNTLNKEEVEDGILGIPFMSLPIEAAQSLMDQLWGAGLRPSEGSGSAGSLAATERHLADIKTIAWHALKINSKQGGAS